MRLFNYLILFSALLAIALFAMQNATPVTVTFAPGVSIESPLVMELLAASGIGATLAWLYSLWMRVQFTVEAREKNRQLQEKEVAITELKEMVVELEGKVKQLPPSKRAEPQEEIQAVEEVTTEGSPA
ncbi:LapA family protein [Thermostichus vulcanus]|uniref:LapA family protein n=1 Tax=Thermostichus vulcanus str. 'Rupite' TaxID=2813851 RepID=A0ABT0C7Q7_THEVL|nr:LapA family protein [Thermostichus vulcanus]MCJ2541774.1 LapA family protein [Thermostichus vulcanus str. 'Rupite']